ncbi:biotin/lipoate A/B protein ligase family protein [Paenibacillus sp. MBLB4367]|uniref:lipoate--protein ligase family protein n=1 Tax=Paenibacillus sp. MBLB4367 TaxID=3384767 RepID=UPI003907FB20
MQLTPWPQGFYIFDSTEKPVSGDVMFPFAWDEAVCRRVGEGANPIVHIWRHPGALVVGLRDRRLPHAEQAMTSLREEGVQTIVRNSGGAAVPLDLGVVNLSIVLPNPERNIHFRDDFTIMVDLIRDSLSPWTGEVADGEIGGAYCPGDYDLSIGGRKFCGIAQRRQTKAYVVQAFIVVEGSGEKRAASARRFYDQAAGETGASGYPLVMPGSMASLQELAGVPSAEAFVGSVKRVLAAKSGIEADFALTGVTQAEVADMSELLRQRYDKSSTQK